MNTKIKIRSKKELYVRKKEFLKFCKILDAFGIKYFLSTGVLLGAIRDKNFIKWDWDVEVSVYSNEFILHIDTLSLKLNKSGFKVFNIVRDKNNLKIDFRGLYPATVTTYTIYGWNYSRFRKVYWRRELSVPEKFYNKLTRIKFFGRYFFCPSYRTDYLTFLYGNWIKPLRSSNKLEYLTKDYKTNTNNLVIFYEKVLINFIKYLDKLKKILYESK